MDKSLQQYASRSICVKLSTQSNKNIPILHLDTVFDKSIFTIRKSPVEKGMDCANFKTDKNIFTRIKNAVNMT